MLRMILRNPSNEVLAVLARAAGASKGWGAYESSLEEAWKNDDEIYDRMHAHAVTNYYKPYGDLEAKITSIRPATLGGLRAKARLALDCGHNSACESEPIILSVLHNVAGREFAEPTI
jgi:hypothetical protein